MNPHAFITKFAGDAPKDVLSQRYGMDVTTKGGNPTPLPLVTDGDESGPRAGIAAPGERTGRWGGDGHQSGVPSHISTTEEGIAYSGQSSPTTGGGGKDSGA